MQFPSQLTQPTEHAQLVQMIVEHDYLDGETIRMDSALRMAPRRIHRLPVKDPPSLVLTHRAISKTRGVLVPWVAKFMLECAQPNFRPSGPDRLICQHRPRRSRHPTRCTANPEFQIGRTEWPNSSNNTFEQDLPICKDIVPAHSRNDDGRDRLRISYFHGWSNLPN